MESWVKSNPTESIPVVHTESSPIPVVHEGIPIELMRFFNVDMREMNDMTKKQLREIYEMNDKKPMGDMLQELKGIETRMGQSNEPRVVRIWNYFKVQGRINDLVKQRDALLRY